MKKTKHVGHIALTIAILVSCLALPRSGQAKNDGKTWRIPVVMEQATMRGKIVVIEDREQDRRVLEGMTVQVWSIADSAEGEKKPKKKRAERGKLLHETKTDDLGMFSLPALEEDEYILIIAELRLLLQVVPTSEKRKGQQEPAVLLIMVPI